MADENQAQFLYVLDEHQKAQERGDFAVADQSALQAMVIAAAAVEADGPDEHLTLIFKAQVYEEEGLWEQARETFHDMLALAEREQNSSHRFRAHEKLSDFYALQNEFGKALKEAIAAVSAARETESEILYAMALENVIRAHLNRDDVSAASAVANELLQIIPSEAMYNLLRARALVLSARCHVKQGKIAEAQTDLDAAMPIFAPREDLQMMAGVQSGLANWWDVLSQIKAASGEPGAAAVAFGKSVQYSRVLAGLPHLKGPYTSRNLARALQRYSEILQKAGDATEAEQLHDESRAILRQIHLAPN